MAAVVRKQKLLAAANAEKVKEIFEKYDADGSGAIDKDELRDALADLGVTGLSRAQVDKIVRRYVADPNAEELNKEQFDLLVKNLQAQQAQMAPEKVGGGRCSRFFPTWKYHEKAHALYTNKYMQQGVASMIIGNFIVNVIEKEIDPRPPQRLLPVWNDFDVAFNVIFLFELLLNAWGCGGPYAKFWSSGWNVFDFIVVAVGLLLMTGIVPPGSPLGNLKMMRAFRVFRLFKRIQSLNKVIMALLKAIPGVMNAFVIMVIFMMIYAILAVEYFAQLGQDYGPHPEGTYVTFNDDTGVNQTISAGTDRGYVYGWEYYGCFTRALFTLFQVMTGESWAEVIVRPLMFGLYRDGVFVAIFFVSFILLTQLVLTNVVVAVLLDKFVEDPNAGGLEEDDTPKAEIDASAFLGGDDDDDDDAPPPGATVAASAGGGAGTVVAATVVAAGTSTRSSTNAPPGLVTSGSAVTETPPSSRGDDGAVFSAMSLDEKMTRLVMELASVRSAVGRCEAEIYDLKTDGGGDRNGAKPW